MYRMEPQWQVALYVLKFEGSKSDFKNECLIVVVQKGVVGCIWLLTQDDTNLLKEIEGRKYYEPNEHKYI